MKSPVLLLFLLWTLSLYADEKWPGVKYTEIRAYAWPKSVETDKVINQGVKLHRDVSNPDGARLSVDQEARLLAAIGSEHTPHRVAACYNPHHLFVFYDGEKPVAYYEVCFSCGGFEFSPQGAAKWNDMVALATIFDELKLFEEFGLEHYKQRAKEHEEEDRKALEEQQKNKK